MTDQVDLVLYHANCRDGLTAAWCIKKKYPEAVCVPAQYGQAPPSVEPGQHVVIVDFSYPKDVLLKMRGDAGHAGSLLVLDHHVSAKRDLEGLDPSWCIFDMTRSGARMAFDYFLPDIQPTLVDYVQDRDLWTWKLPASREISAVIDSYPLTFEGLEQIHNDLAYEWDDVVTEGAAILRYQTRLVERLCEDKRLVQFHGDVYGVNTPVLQSEVANAISAGKPFGVAWYQNAEGLYCYSLRSRSEDPEAVDTSVIAKLYGGGGHKNASGIRSKTRLHE